MLQQTDLPKNNNRELLPEGFYDEFYPNSFKEVSINYKILEFLNDEGFLLIRPAMVEYEKNIFDSSNNNINLNKNKFRVTDPKTGKMLVIRDDITPQISRIISGWNLHEISNKAISLSYSGNVLKRFSTAATPSRQLSQVGFEIINEPHNTANTKLISIINKISKKLHITDFVIDICFPKLLGDIFLELAITETEKHFITNSIESKNAKDISTKAYGTVITELLTESEKLSSVADIKQYLQHFNNYSKQIKQGTCKEDKQIIAVIEKYISQLDFLVGLEIDIPISLSLFEHNGFDYHTGVCYSLISRKNYIEFGRGGNYEITNGNNHLTATGFTFLLNQLISQI